MIVATLFYHTSTPSACDLVLLKSLLESRRPTYLGMESDPLHAPGLPPLPLICWRAQTNLLHIEVSPTNHRAALNGPDSVRFEAESVSRVLAEQPQHA